MTFLNVILLGGMAAASIPLLIHLFNRSKPQVVRWGAMHLLDAAFQAHTRRLKLEQLILLLVRCLIPVLLALCMARPVVTGMQALLGGAQTSLVILLDDSYSMEADGNAGSRFTEAREATGKFLEHAANGSDLAVVLMGGAPRPLLETPTQDALRVTRELARLEPGRGPAAFAESVELALGHAGRMQHPLREFVVLSDFQAVSFGSGVAAGRSRLAGLLKRQPVPPQLTFLRVGGAGRDNVAVESLEYPRLAVGRGQSFPVRANLRNFGERSWPDLRVHFRTDGRERVATQISLAPGEQRQVLFTHTFDTAGSHVIEVQADGDTLKADNRLAAVVPVWDSLPVLLVNGDPGSTPLKGETDFLEIALQPVRAGGNGILQPRVVPVGGLDAGALARSRVVVLANARQLSEAQARLLRDFVENGGGLLIFPGNRVEVDWYQRVLGGPAGLLPRPWAGLAGGLEARAPRTRIATGPSSHPALEIFNDSRNGQLSDAEIQMWFKLGAEEVSEGGDPASAVLSRFESGDAFLVERKFGEGQVIQCAIPCDADWSNLALRPFFLPLMQRLVVHLATEAMPPRNVETGQPLAAVLPRSEVGRNIYFTDPAGVRHGAVVVARGRQGYVEFTATQRPGLYALTAPDGGVSHFAVNAPRSESDLRGLTDEELRALAREVGATVVNSVAEYQQRDRDRRFGREVWRPVLWAVLALLFSELVLVQWFTRRRPAAP